MPSSSASSSSLSLPVSQMSKFSGVPCPATPTRYTAPVHIDVGGSIYTSSLETLTRFPDSRLAKMFNGNIPIVLDTLKQHYFIDREGRLFRHVLNYMRTGRLLLPENFTDTEALLEEARFFEIAPLVRDLENLRVKTTGSRSKDPRPDQDGRPIATNSHTHIKTEPPSSPGSSPSSNHDNQHTATDDVESSVDCVVLNISPDLGERISLSADRSILEEVFPELSSALMDSRNTGWNVDNRYVIRFPLNGYCKLNSLQVMQRLLEVGFTIAASNGGGVEGQQFSEYVFCRRKTAKH